MGWLDNSTNNIILDAVLTDYGRQALARNDGSFRITKFSLGDDEINYGVITKYGRTIGREKIEKNTPVFEAFTNQNLGLKYRMISIPRPLVYLPRIVLTTGNTVSLSSAGGNNIPTSVSVTVEQQPQGADVNIDPDILETNFDVYVPDLFVFIGGQTPVGAPDVNRIALYTLPAVNGSSISSRPKLSFSVNVKSLSQTIFNVYGQTTGNITVINTSIKVVGKSSGAVLDIPVTITKS